MICPSVPEAAMVPEASEGPAKPGREPPTLADRLTRLVVGLAVAGAHRAFFGDFFAQVVCHPA